MEPIFARQVRRGGESTGALERAVRADSFDRIRPGVYVPAEWRAAPDRERHLLKVRAAARVLAPSTVFSHESAAAVYGIPVVGPWPPFVRASYDGPNGRSARVGLRWTRAAWEPGDTEIVAGIHVTTARRTAIDLARSASFAQGVVALDHVIAGGCDRSALVEWLAARRPLHGAGRLGRALEIAHGLAESPLESLSMARIAELGFELPVQQYELVAAGHRYRLDFFWPHAEVAGEADGRSKYLEPDVLWHEKRREDAIRPLVRAFLRWSWSDAVHPESLTRILLSGGIPRV